LWERIAATAGHRTHLESDSAALAEVECVTCHGAEVHRFVPASETCGQAGCHAAEDTRVVLGKMTDETSFHCVTCHGFTVEVAADVPRDTALARLIPGESQCFSCHEMPGLLASFDVEREPHGATCGACHDPHEQETPRQAFESCASAGCHEDPTESTPSHRGLAASVLADCAECHEAHDWVVEGDDCAACHSEIVGERVVRVRNGRGMVAPLVGRAAPGGPRGPNPGARGEALPAQAVDPFDHREHADLECTACHSSEETHGAVTLRGPEDCFSCHHDAPVVTVGCQDCHRSDDLAVVTRVSARLSLSVWDETRTRELPFDHGRHIELECGECHAGSPRLSVQTECGECHEEHHDPVVACAACHEKPAEGAHELQVHTAASCGGSGCHSETIYDAMPRTNGFCLSCHADELEHEPGDPCVSCHLVPAPSPGPPTGQVR